MFVDDSTAVTESAVVNREIKELQKKLDELKQFIGGESNGKDLDVKAKDELADSK